MTFGFFINLNCYWPSLAYAPKKIIMKPHSFQWHVKEDGKLHTFLGHARKISRGDVACIPEKTNKHAHMTERLVELDEWLFFYIL